MAYMNQERKAKIAEALKKVVPEGWKYSLSVRNHSTIVMTISKAPVDLMQEVAYVAGAPAKQDYCQVNVYYPDHFFKKSLPIIKDILAALNLEGTPGANYDNSDIQTDYFDKGWYVDLQIGRWDKPFVYDEENDLKAKKKKQYEEAKAMVLQAKEFSDKHKTTGTFLKPVVALKTDPKISIKVLESNDGPQLVSELSAEAKAALQAEVDKLLLQGYSQGFGLPPKGMFDVTQAANLPATGHPMFGLGDPDPSAISKASVDDFVKKLTTIPMFKVEEGPQTGKVAASEPNIQNLPKDKFKFPLHGEVKFIPQEEPKLYWVKMDPEAFEAPQVGDSKPLWMHALPSVYDKCHSVGWEVKPQYSTVQTMTGETHQVITAQHCKLILNMGDGTSYHVPVPNEVLTNMTEYIKLGNSDVVAFKLAVADALTLHNQPKVKIHANHEALDNALKGIEKFMFPAKDSLPMSAMQVPGCSYYPSMVVKNVQAEATLAPDEYLQLLIDQEMEKQALKNEPKKTLIDIVKESGSTHLIVVKPGEKLK